MYLQKNKSLLATMKRNFVNWRCKNEIDAYKKKKKEKKEALLTIDKIKKKKKLSPEEMFKSIILVILISIK